MRASANRETAGLVAELVRSGHKTIAFCRSRRSTEVVASDARRRLPAQRRRVKPYRGGYLAAERREIEEELFCGRLDGVVATSALELGIDVGGLDAVVLNGFPGTIASFWQQAGRAGRAGQASGGVLVAGDDQLDQWIATHPDELVSRPPGAGGDQPRQPFVADAHLRCAAHEMPLTHADERYWPGDLDEVVAGSCTTTVVVRQQIRGGGPQALYSGGGWPATAWACGPGQGRGEHPHVADGEAVGTVERPGRASRCTPARPTSTRGRPGGSPPSTSTAGRRWSSPTTGRRTPWPAPTSTSGSCVATPPAGVGRWPWASADRRGARAGGRLPAARTP